MMVHLRRVFSELIGGRQPLTDEENEALMARVNAAEKRHNQEADND